MTPIQRKFDVLRIQLIIFQFYIPLENICIFKVQWRGFGQKFTCALFQIDPDVGEDYLGRPDQEDILSQLQPG